MRVTIFFMMGFGLFLLLVGLSFNKTLTAIVGLLIMGGGIYLGFGPQGILRKEQVLDTWAILIEGAQGKAGEIFKNTEGLLRDSKAPSLEIEKREIAPGVVRGFMGKSREFLIVTGRENFRLKPYQIFINARDYGDNLDVSWHLTFKPPLWQTLVFFRVVPRNLIDLDLFDEMDLRAYATNVHHCVQAAVNKIMLDLNQDPSKIDRKSRGFLGIS